MHDEAVAGDDVHSHKHNYEHGAKQSQRRKGSETKSPLTINTWWWGGVVETHLNNNDSVKECKELTQAGWRVSYSPASASDCVL